MGDTTFSSLFSSLAHKKHGNIGTLKFVFSQRHSPGGILLDVRDDESCQGHCGYVLRDSDPEEGGFLEGCQSGFQTEADCEDSRGF